MSGDVQVRFCERLGVKFPRATHLVVLVDGRARYDWLVRAVDTRLREEFATLQVEVNEEKTRTLDLKKEERFGFLGFDIRRVRTLKGRWRAHCTPKLKKRTALLRTLKEEFRRSRSQPVGVVIQRINPILRGWVNYFAVGHSTRCFSYIEAWVEKKIHRHLRRNAKRHGFGWRQWRREWLYRTLGLFAGYRVRPFSTAAVSR
jgi:RNA-directed DNA polymerase